MFPALSSFLFNCGCLSLALASLHHALALRPCHTFLSALLFSFLCARHRSTLFSAFSFASAVLFTTLPYTLTLLCSLRSSRTIYFLFLFSPCFVSLSLSLCFSLISALLLLHTFFARFLLCCSFFFVLCFLASQQFFRRLVSHAFIHFFYRLNLHRFYTSPISSRTLTVSS